MLGWIYIPHAVFCHDLVPSNVSDVNHSVVISAEDTLVKITFQVSPFVSHHMYGYTCETVQAIDCTV